MILEVIRQLSVGLEPFKKLGMGDVAGDDQRARQRQARGDGMTAEGLEYFRHRPVEVDRHGRNIFISACLGEEARRITLEFLDKDPFGRNLGKRLPVGRTGHTDSDGAGRAMPWQPDDPYIVTVVFPAELRTDTQVPRDLQDLHLPFGVAPGMAKFVALRRQAVKRPDRGLLDRFQRCFGRRAANHHREVIGRACRGAQIEYRRADELAKRLRVQHRLGFLVKEGLVGRAAALLDEGKSVFHPLSGIKIDLCRQVGRRVDLVEHACRGKLRIAKIAFLVGVVDATREGFGIVAGHENMVTARS